MGACQARASLSAVAPATLSGEGGAHALERQTSSSFAVLTPRLRTEGFLSESAPLRKPLLPARPRRKRGRAKAAGKNSGVVTIVGQPRRVCRERSSEEETTAREDSQEAVQGTEEEEAPRWEESAVEVETGELTKAALQAQGRCRRLTRIWVWLDQVKNPDH